MTAVIPSLAFAHGGPPLRGRLRSRPEDFRVTEQLGFDADGAGEHVLVEVEKREANTAWVARELARFADVRPRDVGYAGRKDRQAVTRQFFSIWLPGRQAPDWCAFPHADVRIVSSARHGRKLKRGSLAGNRFTLTVREVQGDREQAQARLATVAARGVPNYFGEQRFGREGGNVERALAMFGGQRVERATRSMLLSAARSHLFNRVLATRVEAGTWDQPVDGDIWCLHGSRSHFGPEPFDHVLRQRLDQGDIHPSGPMWGRGEPATTGAARDLETATAAALPRLVAGLEAAGLRQERRPLRLVAGNLDWHWHEPHMLVLDFDLPPGSYATTLVRELVGAPKAP